MTFLPKIAVLDDYQRVALNFADWSSVQAQSEVTIFSDHLADPQSVVDRLTPFDVVCVMRERTPLTAAILGQLPNLKLIVSTGKRNASIDVKAASAQRIAITPTGYVDTGAPELTWALLMALARHLVPENRALAEGGWQQQVGTDISGKTIGIVGLGNIGHRIARYASAFDMRVIAWSEHLTPEKAAAAGAEWVSKESLFRESDFVTLHLILSARSSGIVGATELSWMKPSAYLINTSRGPLIEEEALIKTLRGKKIAGVALDVFDQEPLDASHPLRSLPNVLYTPHIGYVTERTYRTFYQDTVAALEAWLKNV